MRAKKLLALAMSAVLCMSVLSGCGKENKEPVSGNPTQPTSAPEAPTGADKDPLENPEGKNPAENPDETKQPETPADPAEAICQGYYSYCYPVDGLDDMCAFFHFYEEQPVLGSVFYAGYAWNQINFAGTYVLEKKERAYSCIANREDQIADPSVMTEGTAPYTVTFYDFAGNELGSCGFDGDVLYNDTDAVSGMGADKCMFYHDVQGEASPYVATYSAEAGIAYLDFVAADPTSTLTLYHNGRYMDLVDMMVEGKWSMAEGAEGYEYTLTPDSTFDTAAVLAVAKDEQTAVYTPDGGEALGMTNVKAAGPKPALVLIGETPIPGQEINAAVLGSLYDDGTCMLVASAFGMEFPLDGGTWSMGADGYTITFQLQIAGELVSGLGSQGAFLRYVAGSEILGDIDTELVITFPE